MTLFKKSNGQRIPLSQEEEDAIRAEWAANEASSLENKWLHERISHYPKISDQLDMLWHEMGVKGTINKDGEWYKSIEAVKNKYPKPE